MKKIYARLITVVVFVLDSLFVFASPIPRNSQVVAGLTFQSVTSTSLQVTFSPVSPTPAGYIVLMQAYGDPLPDSRPVNGTTYHEGNVIGSSTIVVSVGLETTVTVEYLNPGTPYYFDVLSYDASHVYSTSAMSGNQTTLTSDGGSGGGDGGGTGGGTGGGSGGTGQPTDLQFSLITSSTFTITYDAPSPAPDGYVAVMLPYTSPYPDFKPQDGVEYHIGEVIGSSTIVVGFGPTLYHNLVYMQPSTEYYIALFSFRQTSSGYDYNSENPLQGHQATLANDNGARMASESASAPYPNPFNDVLTIPLKIEKDHTYVDITVFDSMGKAVAHIAGNHFIQGNHEVNWDRLDLNGARLANGIYQYKIMFSDGRVHQGRLLAR